MLGVLIVLVIRQFVQGHAGNEIDYNLHSQRPFDAFELLSPRVVPPAAGGELFVQLLEGCHGRSKKRRRRRFGYLSSARAFVVRDAHHHDNRRCQHQQTDNGDGQHATGLKKKGTRTRNKKCHPGYAAFRLLSAARE